MSVVQVTSVQNGTMGDCSCVLIILKSLIIDRLHARRRPRARSSATTILMPCQIYQRLQRMSNDADAQHDDTVLCVVYQQSTDWTRQDDPPGPMRYHQGACTRLLGDPTTPIVHRALSSAVPPAPSSSCEHVHTTTRASQGTYVHPAGSIVQTLAQQNQQVREHITHSMHVPLFQPHVLCTMVPT